MKFLQILSLSMMTLSPVLATVEIAARVLGDASTGVGSVIGDGVSSPGTGATVKEELDQPIVAASAPAAAATDVVGLTPKKEAAIKDKKKGGVPKTNVRDTPKPKEGKTPVKASDAKKSQSSYTTTVVVVTASTSQVISNPTCPPGQKCDSITTGITQVSTVIGGQTSSYTAYCSMTETRTMVVSTDSQGHATTWQARSCAPALQVSSSITMQASQVSASTSTCSSATMQASQVSASTSTCSSATMQASQVSSSTSACSSPPQPCA